MVPDIDVRAAGGCTMHDAAGCSDSFGVVHGSPYRMPSWQRTLLVVCALPLGEVSCGVDRVTFLHLVSVRVDIRPELACADASLGSAAAGKHLGLASGCFFGLSGVDCAVSSGDDAAVDARFAMLSDVVASCGVLVVGMLKTSETW